MVVAICDFVTFEICGNIFFFAIMLIVDRFINIFSSCYKDVTYALADAKLQFLCYLELCGFF